MINTVFVNLGRHDYCEALEFRDFGEGFELKEIYEYKGFVSVWFRTESGNIYYLDNRAKVTDLRTCARYGVMMNRNEIYKEELDLESLKQKQLVIGKSFYYQIPNHGYTAQTSLIVEIVARKNDRVYSRNYLTKNNFRRNNIALDFLNISGVRNSLEAVQ